MATKKQRALLEWFAGMCPEPPLYRYGGVAPALARLRRIGLISRDNKLTPEGISLLPPAIPKHPAKSRVSD